MKKCAIILSHCNNEEKRGVLLETIDILNKVQDLDIVLTSHIPLDEEVIEKCDYFVYDKENPILEYPERIFFNYWKLPHGENQEVKLIYLLPDYGYGPFNQIKLGYFASLKKHYDQYFIINYDLVIDETIINIIQNDERSLYFQGYTADEKVIAPSLIFMSFKKNHIEDIVNRINREEYKRYDMAEGYMKYILEVLQISKYPDYFLNDKINANSDISTNVNEIFNFSNDDRFSYFFGAKQQENYKEKEKEIHYFYNIKENIRLKKTDGEIVELNVNKNYIIDNDGDLLIDNGYGEFVNLNLRYNGGVPRQLIELYNINE